MRFCCLSTMLCLLTVGRDEIYHYWGTAWSVLGLLETLPAATNPKQIPAE